MHRKVPALVLVLGIALTMLFVLPGAQATGYCAVTRANNQITTSGTCPYQWDGTLQSGYTVALSPGATWRVYYQYYNQFNQLQTVIIQDQNGSGSPGTVPTCSPEVGGLGTANRICAKSLHGQDGWWYGADIFSGSGTIVIGPQTSG